MRFCYLLLLLYITGFLGRSAIVAFLLLRSTPPTLSPSLGFPNAKMSCVRFSYFATLFAYAWYVAAIMEAALLGRLRLCLRLLSKPMAVTLPFALLLLDIWPLHRITFADETRAHWLPSL